MVFCRKSPGTKQPNRSTCRTRDETNRCPAVRLAESQNQIESLLMGLKRCENKWENSKWVRFILFGKQFMEAFFSCRIHPHACLDPYQSRLTNKTNSLNCIPFRRHPSPIGTHSQAHLQTDAIQRWCRFVNCLHCDDARKYTGYIRIIRKQISMPHSLCLAISAKAFIPLTTYTVKCVTEWHVVR